MDAYDLGMTSENPDPELKQVPLAQPRALSTTERALVDFLLAGPLGRDELRMQAETATVVGTCSCGCPSVWLAVDPGAPSATFADEDSVYGRAAAVDITASQRKTRRSTEVTLHVVNGRLWELEIWGGGFGVRPRVNVAKLEYRRSG